MQKFNLSLRLLERATGQENQRGQIATITLTSHQIMVLFSEGSSCYAQEVEKPDLKYCPWPAPWYRKNQNLASNKSLVAWDRPAD